MREVDRLRTSRRPPDPCPCGWAARATDPSPGSNQRKPNHSQKARRGARARPCCCPVHRHPAGEVPAGAVAAAAGSEGQRSHVDAALLAWGAWDEPPQTEPAESSAWRSKIWSTTWTRTVYEPTGGRSPKPMHEISPLIRAGSGEARARGGSGSVGADDTHPARLGRLLELVRRRRGLGAREEAHALSVGRRNRARGEEGREGGRR